MLSALESYFLNLEEPALGCMLALRKFILDFNEEISPDWKYGMPFFNYQGKRICYLWVDKKTKFPYIGFVQGNRLDHPLLEQGSRLKMKILPVDPNADIPILLIEEILNQVLVLTKKRSQ